MTTPVTRQSQNEKIVPNSSHNIAIGEEYAKTRDSSKSSKVSTPFSSGNFSSRSSAGVTILPPPPRSKGDNVTLITPNNSHYPIYMPSLTHSTQATIDKIYKGMVASAVTGGGSKNSNGNNSSHSKDNCVPTNHRPQIILDITNTQEQLHQMVVDSSSTSPSFAQEISGPLGNSSSSTVSPNENENKPLSRRTSGSGKRQLQSQQEQQILMNEISEVTAALKEVSRSNSNFQ
jgi:hypothetical protein